MHYPTSEDEGGPSADQRGCHDKGRHRSRRSHSRSRNRSRSRSLREGGDKSSRSGSRRTSSPGGGYSSRSGRSGEGRRGRRRRRSSRSSSSSSSSSSQSSRHRSKSRRRRRRDRVDEKRRGRSRKGGDGGSGKRRGGHRRGKSAEDDSSSSPSSSSSTHKRGKSRKRRRHDRHGSNAIAADNPDKHTTGYDGREDGPARNVHDGAATATKISNIVANMATGNSNPPAAAAVRVPSRGPMTHGEYLKLQGRIREVVDPHTGRTRLIRGTGEVIERIVSRDEHCRLNRCATSGDGSGFAREIMRAAAASSSTMAKR